MAPDEGREILANIRRFQISMERVRQPIPGARIHVGKDTLDSLRRLAVDPLVAPWAVPVTAAWGMPVVLEADADPNLAEVRWNLRG